MSRYISEQLRRLVANRATNLCEYCLIHEEDTFFLCQVDHIISLKHGGKTEAENLAYTCAFCNRNKGSDVGSILSINNFVRFFNPRTDKWPDHFQLEGTIIKPTTDIGETTAKILDFNNIDRIIERQTLIDLGRYPHPSAIEYIKK
jgi:hypothetical protein